jgi:hypothetical protein
MHSMPAVSKFQAMEIKPSNRMKSGTHPRPKVAFEMHRLDWQSRYVPAG